MIPAASNAASSPRLMPARSRREAACVRMTRWAAGCIGVDGVASHVLPFEKPVVELVTRVKELRALAEQDRRFEGELRRLEEKAGKLARELFADLTPWQKVQLSRHPNRPYTLDYF